MKPIPSTPAADKGRRVVRWHTVITAAVQVSVLAAGPMGWVTTAAAGVKPASAARARTDTAALPEVNLRIDWRQVDDEVLDEPRRGREAVVVGTGGRSTPGGKQWSTERRRSDDFGLQGVQVQLRNGGSAQLQWQRDVSVEWTAEALLPPGGGAVGQPGLAGGNAGPVRGMSRQLIWLPSGQRLAVHARWPGGTMPVSVDVDIDERSLEPASGGGVSTARCSPRWGPG